MKLLVILLCLLSERFLIHTISYQRFDWFNPYSLFIKQTIAKHNLFSNPWLLLAALVLPIILITGLVYSLLHSVLFGFIGLVLSIIIFFYCLGPQNAFYPLSDSNASSSDETFIGQYLAKANNQLFSALFWYVIAGPIAVLAYRLISLSREIDWASAPAKQVSDLLEWLPARMTVLSYLLVGNFQRGFSLFIRLFLSSPAANNQLLSECGLRALRTNDADEVTMPAAESLVEHATIVLLVLIALFTLVAWL